MIMRILLEVTMNSVEEWEGGDPWREVF